jgi:hypothetical protein
LFFSNSWICFSMHFCVSITVCGWFVLKEWQDLMMMMMKCLRDGKMCCEYLFFFVVWYGC